MNNDFSKKGQINTNPVAWQLFKETTPDYLYITDSYSIACEWKSKLNSNEKIIPLYTTPQIKELSDEEILNVAFCCEVNTVAIENDWDGTVIDFARAILKKASEK